MIIYKDIITGDKMFSDNYPMKLINDVIYEVQGKWISRDPNTIAIANENLSTEGVEGDYKDQTELGIDIVMNFHLRECFRFHNKESFILYLKKYMKKVIEKLQDSTPDQVDIFKNNMNNTMLKYTLGHFEELEFYTGVSMDDNGMVAVCEYQVIDNELVPFLKFFKHGLLEERY